MPEHQRTILIKRKGKEKKKKRKEDGIKFPS
jgi:hypothetical protein